MRKPFLTVLILSLVSLGLAQTVTRTELAKDNGKGKPGQVVKGFAPTDNPIHCVLHLKPLTSPAVFTATLVAVHAADVQNYQVAMTNIAASAPMDLVDFKFSLPRNWPAG